MEKIFVLNLKNIEYLGDSIGGDIFIEIEVASQSFKINSTIKRGSKVDVNKEVAYFETAENNINLSIHIKIIEKDILFDDAGGTQGSMKIDLTSSLPQDQVFEIKVSENRGVSGKRTATFRVVLEVATAIRYVEDVDRQGWLKAKSDDSSEEFSIPIHLKVQLSSKDEHRERFTILEGVRKNTKASVSLKEDGSSRFSKMNPHKKSVNPTYSISKKTLTLSRKIYKTTDYPEAPWTKGVYEIEIPDYPHELGLGYIGVAPHAITWFRVNYEKDRYIHTGGNSLGCITVIEKNRWDELYAVLILARRGDSLNIGTLKVVD